MQVVETVNKGLKRGFKITVEASVIDERIDEKLKSLAPTVSLDGFRPGKVPLSVVKKKYGERVRSEVLELVVGETTQKMIVDKGLRPALQPKIDVTTFPDDCDMEYTVEFENYPDVTEIDTKSLKLDTYKVEAKADDVNEGMKRLLEAQKDYKPVETKRAAKKGDAVLMDYLGKVDGEPFDGGKGSGIRLVLGSGQFIPGFEDQLVGAKKDADIEVNVTFPEDYNAENLKGKAAVFEVKVLDILEAADPELNEEFAQKFGFDSVEKLQDAVKEQIQKEYETIARTKVKKELFDHLDKACSFDVPEGMLELELQALAQGKQEELSAKEKKENDKLANRRIRLGMVLAELGKKEKIEVNEAEVRQAVFEVARNYPGQEQQVMEYYKNTPQALEQLKGPILEEKVVDFILENAKVTQKDITVDDLKKFAESEA